MLDVPVTDAAREWSNSAQHGKNEARQRTPQQQLLAEINRNLYAYVHENNLTSAVKRLAEEFSHSPKPSPTPATRKQRIVKPLSAITNTRHAKPKEVLDLLLAFFADGRRWIKGRMVDKQGNRCLMGGLEYVREHHQIDWQSTNEAERCLCRALPKRRNQHSLIAFNDSSSSFAEVRALILKAQELAALPDTGKQPRPRRPSRRRQPRSRQWQAPMITEGNPLTEPECASLAKLEAADERKRQVLAEIELENMARAARGDFRATYILCPKQPSHWQVEKIVEAHAVTPPTLDARSPASGFAPIEAVPAR